MILEHATLTATDALLSLVVPTTGKERNLVRCIQSFVDCGRAELLAKTELVVFINVDPTTPVAFDRIDQYLETLKGKFASITKVVAEKFHLTAEESAWEAIQYAHAPYLQICGDKRIFLPEGLAALWEYLIDPPTRCAYFNSVWIDADGYSIGYPSTHFAASKATVDYKDFVVQNGINFIATAMGSWVYERQLMDRAVWREIIDTCGPHFSHVTTLLSTLNVGSVTCYARHLFLLESKAYHSGDDSEWARYAKLAKCYRFYPWTLGLVRQFNYLIAHGTYTPSDVRRSMCSEALLLKRQVDDIYMHVLTQLRSGWASAKERLTRAEFDEIITFLDRVAPEKAIVNWRLRALYQNHVKMPDAEFFNTMHSISGAVHTDHADVRLVSLIVGQISDRFVRLHPRGYVISKVKDQEQFLLAYKMLDAPRQGRKWQILSEEELAQLPPPKRVPLTSELFPQVHHHVVDRRGRLRRFTSPLIRSLYKRRIVVRLTAMLPAPIKTRLRRWLL